MNGQVTDVAFTPDNKHLLSAGSKSILLSLPPSLLSSLTSSLSRHLIRLPSSSPFLSPADGHVYVWDLHSRDCVHRFIDDGCIKGTCLGVSPSGSHVACGSDSGVVNLYDWSSCFLDSKPKPLKAIMNLTTSINSVQFNHSG